MMLKTSAKGNVLFYILIAIVLMGWLTVALRSGNEADRGIDRENASVKADQMLSYGAELQQAVTTMLDNGVSEADLRFAHPEALPDYGTITTTPSFQVFSNQGGKAVYRLPPKGVNDGTKWSFTAGRAMPQVGSERSDLTLGLASVTDEICKAVDEKLGFTSVPSTNCGGAPSFMGTYETPIALSPAAFSKLPADVVCINCVDRSMNIFFYTLLAR